ncbi:MAG: DUF58 domain-containing protein [Planctomycetota bacterium]
MPAPRVAIRPSALGSKGLLLFAALELAFLATNYSNLFFLLLAFSAVLGLLGAWWSWRNLRGVQVTAVDVGLAAEGGQRDVSVRVHGGRRPRFDVAIELPLARERAEIAYAPVLVGDAELRGQLAPQPRGVRRLEQALVTSKFPFGFFVTTCRTPLACELVTHPEPLAIPGSGTGRGNGEGDDGAQSPGRGTGLAGLRPFRTGDALADVHWKATARRGTAVIKERERDSRPLVDVVLDRRCDEATFERALSHATTLVLAARHGAPVRLRSQDAELLVDPERGGTEAALRWLAEATPLAAAAAPPPRSRDAITLPERSWSAP